MGRRLENQFEEDMRTLRNGIDVAMTTIRETFEEDPHGEVHIDVGKTNDVGRRYPFLTAKARSSNSREEYADEGLWKYDYDCFLPSILRDKDLPESQFIQKYAVPFDVLYPWEEYRERSKIASLLDLDHQEPPEVSFWLDDYTPRLTNQVDMSVYPFELATWMCLDILKSLYSEYRTYKTYKKSEHIEELEKEYNELLRMRLTTYDVDEGNIYIRINSQDKANKAETPQVDRGTWLKDGRSFNLFSMPTCNETPTFIAKSMCSLTSTNGPLITFTSRNGLSHTFDVKNLISSNDCCFARANH